MTTRRQFLKTGLTGVTLLGVPAFGWTAPSLGPHTPFYKVIFDERFPASVTLAREISGSAAPLHRIAGDVTALWYQDLFGEWRKRPAPIAGVTTATSVFCLEVLARDAGLCVIERQRVDEDLVRWSIGPRTRPL